MDDNIYIEDFSNRLVHLRQQKNVSARDMSLSLGQGHSFIHSIESGNNFPTMLNFFYMCEFLEIAPKDFFDYGKLNSARMATMIEQLERLSDEQFDSIASVIEHMNA
ncbi:helix-turn-helix transcriptional regulator [Bengtsoniella intestinalis]|uniref:helix-turn-helix domain-containing protein n=1 Tax=Bengtsoniella intestinalis TaxID=3073143 RepID=UPI00391FB168